MTRGDPLIDALKISAILLVSALLSASPALPQQGKAASIPTPIAQVYHVQGDPYTGFRTACMVLFSDGRYHREHRVQNSNGGYARSGWESPAVFEGALSAGEVQALLVQVDAPSFSSVSGVGGDLLELRYKVLFFPDGHVVPHDNIDFFTVAVAHPRSVQVFEIDPAAAHREPVSKFIDWFHAVRKMSATRMSAVQANGCFSLADKASSAEQRPMMNGFQYPAVRGSVPTFPPGSAGPGKVKLEFVVNPDGTAGDIRVQTSTTPDGAQIALAAAKKWEFYPARLLGVPVGFAMQADIVFSQNSTVTLAPLSRLHSALGR